VFYRDFFQGFLNVTLEERDVVAIHRLPAEHEPSPLIVRLFSSDVKRSVMRVRKELKFVDDVTQRNMELIKRLERSQRFDQASLSSKVTFRSRLTKLRKS
jgi:hypothetical protein